MGKIPIISPKVDNKRQEAGLCSASSFNTGNQSKMNNREIELLKSILSIPTRYREEYRVVEFIVDWCDKKGYKTEVDDIGNVLVTKGQVEENQHYPVLICHTDSVHPIQNKHIQMDLNQEYMFAVSDEGFPVGCAGDNLCGVFAAIQLLQLLDVVKVGFYVQEEIGCIGSFHSTKSNPNWYENISYIIGLDSPGDRQVSEFSNGVRLFNREGDFFKIVNPILKLFIPNGPQYVSHPYCDSYSVCQETRKIQGSNIQSINLPVGYKNYHDKSETVHLVSVQRAVNMGLALIQSLGNKKY